MVYILAASANDHATSRRRAPLRCRIGACSCVRPGRHPDASRRTHVARERTLLAWWRTRVAVGAAALAIGGLVPKVSHAPNKRFIAQGIGYGLRALIFVIGGSVRDRAVQRAIAASCRAVVTAITVSLTGAHRAVGRCAALARGRAPP
jgi:putative membrane protein